MVNLTNAKLWIGDNPYLMKAIVKRIIELKVPESDTGKGKSIKDALSIFFSSEGWYCGYSERHAQFKTSLRPEIKIKDILPIVTDIYNKVIYVKCLSEYGFKILQEYLFNLGYTWYMSDKIKSKSELTNICWLYITKTLGWDREDIIIKDITEYIFPCQLEIFNNKVESQHNGEILSDYGIKQYSSVEIRDIYNNLISIISIKEAKRRYPDIFINNHRAKVIIDSNLSFLPDVSNLFLNTFKQYTKSPIKQLLNHELQRSSETDTTATRGSAIRSYIDECQIATGQRYIGNNTRVIQIEPEIERSLLSNSILRSNYY